MNKKCLNCIMQKAVNKIPLILTVFVILIISAFVFPLAVIAQENEAPSITAVYYDEYGKKVDGNKLSSGNYKMELVLSGFQNLSEMEFTASYNNNVIIDANSVICNIANNNPSISSLCKVADGNIVVCIVSLNDDFSNISSDGVTVFSADITVRFDGELDMENVITENESANFTFVENNYRDVNKVNVPWVYNCFGFENQNQDYAGVVTYMCFDMSPELSVDSDVSGKIVAMINPNDPNNVIGANPVSNVNVIVNGQVADVTDESGNFSVKLPDGRNEVVFDYRYGPARTVTINVDGSSLDVGSITIVTADMNDDGIITYTDTGIFDKALLDSDLIGDVNKDGIVSYTDTGIFDTFLLKGLENIYTKIIIN